MPFVVSNMVEMTCTFQVLPSTLTESLFGSNPYATYRVANPIFVLTVSGISAPLYGPLCVLKPQLLRDPTYIFSGMNGHVEKWIKTSRCVFTITTSFSPALQGLCNSVHINLGSMTLHSTPPSSLLSLSPLLSWVSFPFSCFTYDFLLYKVFKILFVLYDVSMVMFFIKEEENLFLLLVCFIILF